MSNPFFEHPILYSPYEYPPRHWELDDNGQPTQRIVDRRRRAEFITPIPKPKKRKEAVTQQQIVFDEGKGISTAKQQYDPTSIINELRQQVDQWRNLPSPNQWQVTPETAHLLQHWRHHQFSGFRPFFCQIEAAETAIWLTEVAPQAGNTGKRILEHIASAIRRAIHITRKTNRAATDMDRAMIHMDPVSGRKKSALLVGFFGASLTSWQKPAGRVSIQAVLVRP